MLIVYKNYSLRNSYFLRKQREKLPQNVGLKNKTTIIQFSFTLCSMDQSKIVMTNKNTF